MTTPRTVQQVIEAQIGSLAFTLAVMTAENDRLKAENEQLRERLPKDVEVKRAD